jgi:hypothetical protein
MRVLQRVGWDADGCAALRWIEMGEDCYHDLDYLFLNRPLHLTFDSDLGYRCMICGEKADAREKVKEPYCNRHAAILCKCIREGVAKHNCTATNYKCERSWVNRGSCFIPYLAIGALEYNLKIGVTLNRRKEIRAAEQGATAILPIIHQDGYAFNLKDAQRIEDLLSGEAFGYNLLQYDSNKTARVAQNYLPHPIHDPLPFFTADIELAQKRLEDAFPKIKSKCLSLIKQRFGPGSDDQKLIEKLECEKALGSICSALIDEKALVKIHKSKVKPGDVKIGIFGDLVAAKGQLLLVKNGDSYLCYRMKEARGLAEGKVSQRQLSSFLQGGY